ncbi:MAG: Bug family tripartite tricarboxylate transporter substrate binding protein [Burkholderiaceae bacterium]
MKKTSMNIARLVLIGAALAMPGLPSAQSTFPSKPIRLVTSLPPGLVTYVRVLGARLSDQLGVPVAVETRLGANFVVAAQAVAGAPPDGHTLLIQSALALVAKNVLPGLLFEPINDFAAVAKIYDKGSSVLVVRNELPANNIEVFISLAKASPGKLSYGSTGNGAINNVATELMQRSSIKNNRCSRDVFMTRSSTINPASAMMKPTPPYR